MLRVAHDAQVSAEAYQAFSLELLPRGFTRCILTDIMPLFLTDSARIDPNFTCRLCGAHAYTDAEAYDKMLPALPRSSATCIRRNQSRKSTVEAAPAISYRLRFSCMCVIEFAANVGCNLLGHMANIVRQILRARRSH